MGFTNKTGDEHIGVGMQPMVLGVKKSEGLIFGINRLDKHLEITSFRAGGNIARFDMEQIDGLIDVLEFFKKKLHELPA